MNKTETINIGGRGFTIDQDAYTLLEDYMNELDNYFSGHEGKEEIMSDIEVRMAELLQSKVGDTKSVVGKIDVESAIRTLGRPNDFDKEDTMNERDSGSKTVQKKLFRDPRDKKIAGVCSGLAAYFGIDTFLVRLLFVALFLLGFGITLLLYIFIWAFVPYAKTASDRLAMRGEPIDLDHIVKDVEKGVYKLGDAIQDIADKIDKKQKR